MKKIIAFGASSSKKSINKQLAAYAAGQFENASVEVLDLNDYEMPIYSMDKETESGIPGLATDFYNKLGTADLLVISFAEHNGAYSTAFKNIFDWTSRIHSETFKNKQTNANNVYITWTKRWKLRFRNSKKPFPFSRRRGKSKLFVTKF